MLKFFPIALLGLSVRERPGRAAAILAAGVGTFALIYWLHLAEHRLIMDRIPRCGHLCDQFWVGNIPFRLLDSDRASGAALAVHAGATARFLVAVGGLAWWASRRGFMSPDLQDRDTTFFIAGGILMCACYIAEANTYYRAILLLLTVPFLVRVGFATGSDGLSNRAAMTLFWIVMFLFWISPLILYARFALWSLGYGNSPTLLPVRMMFLARDVGWFVGMAGIGALTLIAMLPVLNSAIAKVRRLDA